MKGDILFHLSDDYKNRWAKRTKVMFDVQQELTHTWGASPHDDSKLITRQQTAKCCEDKGLAFLFFSCSLNRNGLKKKGSHMKEQACWEGTIFLVKSLSHLHPSTLKGGAENVAAICL